MEQEEGISINPDDYRQTGLYIVLKDATCLELTNENVERVTRAYWEDPARIPPQVKQAVAFQRCVSCPARAEGDFCNALRPVLPYLEVVDRYVSFDEATAIYRPDAEGVLHVARTTMQEALRYISILSMMNYCQAGRKYWKYGFGIVPIMRGKELASRLYLNMYWVHRGDREVVDQLIAEFYDAVAIITRNQVERLRLICKSDAFLNAFISAHDVVWTLDLNKDALLAETFERFGKEMRYT